MTSEQQARFALQARALRDKTLSHGAYRLLMMLDSEAWGNDGLKLRQKIIAPLLDLKERELRTLTGELVAGRYIVVRHTMTGNVYDFNRQKPAASEQDSATGTGNKLPVESAINCPSIIIDKKPLVEPPLPPASGGINVLSLEGAYEGCTLCPACDGRPQVPARAARSDRRAAKYRWCPHCDKRGFMYPPPRTVSFGAKAS